MRTSMGTVRVCSMPSPLTADSNRLCPLSPQAAGQRPTGHGGGAQAEVAVARLRRMPVRVAGLGAFDVRVAVPGRRRLGQGQQQGEPEQPGQAVRRGRWTRAMGSGAHLRSPRAGIAGGAEQ